jgi:hypothetical protein
LLTRVGEGSRRGEARKKTGFHAEFFNVRIKPVYVFNDPVRDPRRWENRNIFSARQDFVADTRFAAMKLHRRSFHNFWMKDFN